MAAASKDEARNRAETTFKKATREDKDRATAEYEAQAEAVRANSARLKTLRLAAEAAREEPAPKKKPAPRKKKASA